MNERGHVTNAVVLSVGVGVVLEPSWSWAMVVSVASVMPPIVLGALFPDIDTSFGTHRKTFHNVWVLGVAVAFPFVFGNLQYVWIGVGTHYVLDLLGNVKGMAVFYPFGGFYDVPVGVRIDSRWADVATVAVTGFEVGVVVWVASLGYDGLLSTPAVPVGVRDVVASLF